MESFASLILGSQFRKAAYPALDVFDASRHRRAVNVTVSLIARYMLRYLVRGAKSDVLVKRIVGWCTASFDVCAHGRKVVLLNTPSYCGRWVV